MTTFTFEHVYIEAYSAIGGKKEKEGPCGDDFDGYSEDIYFHAKSFELAEQQMVKESIALTLKKAQLHLPKLAIGGDLIHQNGTSSYVAQTLHAPFIGVYGACSTSALSIGTAALLVENENIDHVLAFTSSHTEASERQFRYPNEYGGQKKETSTVTVTAAGSLLLTKKYHPLKVTSFTIGEVIDWEFKDPNDMGKAMVPAAYQTLMTHFFDTKRTFDDYDLIVTGDLGKIGYAMMAELVELQRFQLEGKLNDCGIMIYDLNHQDVFCGGSGCGCSMSVLCSKLLKKLEKKEMKRILFIATGCLHNVLSIQQKQSIPVIAHAICIERSSS